MPFQFQPYDYRGAGTIADLMQGPARARAAALRASGEMRARESFERGQRNAQLIGNLGQIAQGTIGALMQQKYEAPLRAAEAAERANRAQLMGVQLQEAQRATNERENYDLAMQAGSRQATLKALEGRPELYDKAQKHFEAVDTHLKRLFGEAAASIRGFGDAPEAALLAIDDLIEQGFDARRLVPIRQQIQQDPKSVSQIVDAILLQSPDEAHHKMVRQPKVPEAYTLGEGQQRRGPNNELLAENPPAPPAPPKPPAPPAVGSFEDYVIRTYGPNPTSAQITDARKTYMQADDRPRVTVQTEPPPVVISSPTGPQLLDRKTGTAKPVLGQDQQPIGPPMSAIERLDARKFAKAAPVLRSVSELSEKINTQAGLIAKMAGGVKKVAAQANYDDDVAEYTSLVLGFTPLVARALGHTGVLTEQDVVSVRALFPKPGDSKTLRDRKIARIEYIVKQLEQQDRPVTPSQQGDPLGIR